MQEAALGTRGGWDGRDLESLKSEAASDGIGISQALRIVWAYRFLIAGFALFFLALASGYVYTRKPVYKAASKFICKESGGNQPEGLSALASLAGIKTGSGGGSSPSSYFEEILADDEFLEKVLAKQWETDGGPKTLQDIWLMVPDKTKPDWEYAFRKGAVSRLRSGKYIVLEKNGSNGVFSLKTRFSSARLTYDVNVFILHLLNQYLGDNLSTNTREKKTFIGTRLVEIEAELRKTESAIADFRERNKDIMAPKLMIEQARLQRTLRINEEIYLQLKKEYEMAKIEESNDTPLIEVISKPVVPVGADPGKTKAILPISLVLGAVTGILLAFLLGWRRGMLASGVPSATPGTRAGEGSPEPV